MTGNQQRQSRLWGEVSSNGDESSLSGSEEEQLSQLLGERRSQLWEDASSHGDESSLSGNEEEQLSQLLGERRSQLWGDSSSHGDESSLSGNDEEQLSQLMGERRSQLWGDASSHGDESSLSGNDEEQLSQLMAERQAQLRGDALSDEDESSSRAGSSSSVDSALGSRSKRQRRCSPGSEGSKGQRSLVAHALNCLPPGYANGGTRENPELYESGLQYQEGTGSPTGQVSNLGDPELVSGTTLRRGDTPRSRISSSSEGELPRPRALRQGHVRGIQDPSTSSLELSDVEGGGDLESMVGQDLGLGLCEVADEVPQFDYRGKLSPLSDQELISFVFHDLRVTHHIPRTAEQGFRSLHRSDAPSDYRTTRKRMEKVTGLEEVRYDCCKKGCISYSIPRYNSLEECPMCKHARFKDDGKPYAQHAYIPITHRLRLMYADKQRALEMVAYRDKMEEEMKTEVCNT